jgi:SAM-dependent methyltransferase
VDEGSGAFTQATGRQLEGGTGQPRYRRYQYDLIAPHCGRSILEIGAGLGEFAAQFHGLDRLVVTDVDPDAVAVLGRRFADRPEVRARRLDLDELAARGAEPADPTDPVDPVDPVDPADPADPVDTVIAINVLEHIDDDAAALRAMARLVHPGGRLVLWVPGYPQLYGEFDRRVGHVRRYTPATLADAFRRAGLEVELHRPVNLLGGVAWWVAVRRGGAGSPDPRLVGLYDRVVVPVTRAVERVVRVPFGQSVLGVARRPAGGSG